MKDIAKDTQLNIRLPLKILEELKKRANKEYQNVSEYVRNLIIREVKTK